MLMLFAALLTLTSSAILAQKPTESEKRANDLRLIIESNERGKKAQAIVPVLEQKVAVLDTIVKAQAELLHSKDSTISDVKKQVVFLQQVHSNDSAIIGNHAAIERTLQLNLDKAIKNEKKAKRRTVFVGIVGALVSGYLGFKLITR